MSSIELPRVRIQQISALVLSEPLCLINRFPGPGERDVSRNTSIDLQLVDLGDSGLDVASTCVWIDDVLAFAGAIQEPFGGSYVQQGNNISIALTPAGPFQSQETITVRVTASTLDVQTYLNEQYSFIIEDRTEPKVVAAQAVSPRLVKVVFDEDVTIVDSGKIQFEAVGVPAVPVFAVGAIAEGSVVEVMLDTEMTPGVMYTVQAVGVTDVKGNPVDSHFDTARFQGFQPPRPSTRRFELWSMLPAYNRRMDTTGDLKKFVSCIQEVTDLLLAEVDRFSDIFDIERAPEEFVALILQDLGNPFRFDLEEIEKRPLAPSLLDMYRMKGTAPGIKNAVRFFLGLEIEIVPYAGESLVLGESELGVDWVLGPSDSFARYAFDVVADQELTDSQRKHIRTLVSQLKPAHAHFIRLVEPEGPEPAEFWILGEGELGLATMLG